MASTIKDLEKYLRHFGEVRIYDYQYHKNGGEIYASLELITSFRLAEGLEKMINEQINPNGTNIIPAFMRFIGIQEQKDGKIRYTVEIVPEMNRVVLPKEYSIPTNSTAEIEKGKYATQLFLQALPKAFKNIRQKKLNLKKIS